MAMEAPFMTQIVQVSEVMKECQEDWVSVSVARSSSGMTHEPHLIQEHHKYRSGVDVDAISPDLQALHMASQRERQRAITESGRRGRSEEFVKYAEAVLREAGLCPE